MNRRKIISCFVYLILNFLPILPHNENKNNEGIYTPASHITTNNTAAAPTELEIPHIEHKKITNNDKKPWTFIVYMAADNDLAPFSRKNLSQMASIGSTDSINIVVHLDTKIPGNKKITKRYYVQKNQLIIMNNDDQSTQSMDSGSPDTLINCCRWAIKNFPADNYALILWNHGTGIIDISRPRSINPSELFIFNPATNLIELDRTIPFLEFVQMKACDPRGICFDDTTNHYLTNQGLEQALKTICNRFLHGRKFNIIGFDACHMAMLEIANIIKDYAHLTVGSEEVELGTGWRYDLVLAPFIEGHMDQYSFAEHIVNAYEKTYAKITHDYTQSAIDLDQIQLLEDMLDNIARLLIECLTNQANNSVKEALKASRHKLLCTHFDEPSFIDLHHLLTNILHNLHKFKLQNKRMQTRIIKDLKDQLSLATNLIVKITIANTAGKNLHKAQGIAIYFPEQRIHHSYKKTKFAINNRWINFLQLYLTTT